MRLLAAMSAVWAVAVFPGRTEAAERAGRCLPDHSFSVGWVLPFALMLLAIAILPLAVPRGWESNRHKLWVSLLLGPPVLILSLGRGPCAVLSTGLEFTSFMILLGSLYVVSRGVFLAGDLRATPQTNTPFLAVGTVPASLIGTTGASLFLIRPVLKTNRERLHKSHTVVFFIFLVSNIGGSLTPLGDPALLPGQHPYLFGIPQFGQGTLPSQRGGRGGPRGAAGHQPRVGVHGGQHPHRERAQLHGQVRGRGARGQEPSYFGYMLYRAGVLIPVFLGVTFLFFLS